MLRAGVVLAWNNGKVGCITADGSLENLDFGRISVITIDAIVKIYRFIACLVATAVDVADKQSTIVVTTMDGDIDPTRHVAVDIASAVKGANRAAQNGQVDVAFNFVRSSRIVLNI